jgi:hypothetical protein
MVTLTFAKTLTESTIVTKWSLLVIAIDSHYSSFHETDPDGMGGGEELELAIKRLARWVEAFPVADVTIGNHDRIISRKAFSGGIPKAWIKSFNEVLERSNVAIC